MEFKIPCVRKHLEENGFVFAVDSKDYGKLKYQEVDGLGNVIVRKVKKVEYDVDLLEYCQCSGFMDESGLLNPREWWQTIEKFCKGKPKYLYLVVRLEK